jgi:hypothetical protein
VTLIVLDRVAEEERMRKKKSSARATTRSKTDKFKVILRSASQSKASIRRGGKIETKKKAKRELTSKITDNNG